MRAFPVRGMVSIHARRVPAGQSTEQPKKKKKPSLAKAASWAPATWTVVSDQAALQNCALLGT